MKDRSVEFPNRYRLAKVAGTNDIYDLIPAPGDVTEEGTYINKGTLLTDETAALFGLGGDAVPNDVLGILSRLHGGLGNEYVWAKTKGEYVKELGTAAGLRISNSYIVTYYMSDEVEIVDGVVTLVNPVLVSDGANAINKYVEHSTGAIYYMVSRTYVDSLNYDYMAQLVSAVLNVVSYGYVNSPDPLAYPPAEDDGYTYTALGQLGNFRTVPQGWAVIPENMICENFPFGVVEAEEVNGIMTVTKWTAGTIPDPEPVEEVKTTDERIAELEAQLAESDEAAIALYEAQAQQEAINAEQDEAILGIYEMIGG